MPNGRMIPATIFILYFYLKINEMERNDIAHIQIIQAFVTVNFGPWSAFDQSEL
jgi:predicted metal-binding membrane protein